MRYAEYAPAETLRGFVDRYWSLDDASPSAAPHLVLPDGHPEWVVHLGAPFKDQPAILSIGQMTAPVSLTAGGPLKVFGIRFRPEGAWAFSRAPQDEFRDRILDLTAVIPAAARWLEESGRGDTVAATDRFLLSRLQCKEADARVRGAVDQLLAGSSLAGTAYNCGWSIRQMERAVNERTGLSPKTLARLGRFQRAVRLRSTGEAWASIAAECGYTDQSHLIRDFRQFGGSAPSSLASSEMTLAMVR